MQVPFTVFYLKCSLPTFFFQVKSYRYRFSCVTAGVDDHSNAVPLNINELGSCVFAYSRELGYSQNSR